MNFLTGACAHAVCVGGFLDTRGNPSCDGVLCVRCAASSGAHALTFFRWPR